MGRMSASLIASRPWVVLGRKRISSWMSGARLSSHMICVMRACRRDLAEMGEFRLIDDGSRLNQPEAVVRQGEQSADSGNAANRCNGRGATLNLFGATTFGGDLELSVDG